MKDSLWFHILSRQNCIALQPLHKSTKHLLDLAAVPPDGRVQRRDRPQNGQWSMALVNRKKFLKRTCFNHQKENAVCVPLVVTGIPLNCFLLSRGCKQPTQSCTNENTGCVLVISIWDAKSTYLPGEKLT